MDIKKMMLEKMENSTESIMPEALNDGRLEDAFKSPECNEDGFAPSMPAIWNSCSYGQTSDGVKILSLRSASIASDLYSHYLEEESLVWDAAEQELFLYIPDEKCPAIAFKGSCWLCAKKLKMENRNLNIYDVYKEISLKIQDEMTSKNELA